MYPISFKSTNDEYNSNNIKKRFTRLLGGTIVGGAAALPYYKYQKNYTGKKLFFNSLETGAAVGLFVDVVSLIFEMPNAMKKGLNVQNGIKQSDSINLEPYKNKDFFINLYSNKNQNSQELNEYQEKLNDKDFCNSLFQNKDILKASQEALLEVNNAKIAEALKNNDTETIKQLELMNALLLAGIKSDTQTNMSDNHTQNPSFKSIFNLFHENNETLKQKAEVIVNRHASSAATASALLANGYGADAAALTFITKRMSKKVFEIYNCNGGVVAAVTNVLVGAGVGILLASKGATIWPGVGNALNATITYTLHQLQGRALIEFLEENRNDLGDMSTADAVAKFIYRLKMAFHAIENPKIRNFLENLLDKSLDVFL